MRKGLLMVFAAAMWTAPTAAADSGSSAAPTPPAPVISTGGQVSGTSQGSSCGDRQPQKFAPTATSNPYAWAEPDWPGFFTINTPQSSGGCSR
jgi:hypothetical protein